MLVIKQMFYLNKNDQNTFAKSQKNAENEGLEKTVNSCFRPILAKLPQVIRVCTDPWGLRKG